jgi:NADPH:quinone reductase-like Zn-dependent oxidoreductase
MEAGETLLVLGAAGGVGLAAVEIGKSMGARVIAAASTPEKLAVAMSMARVRPSTTRRISSQIESWH